MRTSKYNEEGHACQGKEQKQDLIYENRTRSARRLSRTPKIMEVELRITPRTAYSYLSASIGFSREAFRAGKNPETTPTMRQDRERNDHHAHGSVQEDGAFVIGGLVELVVERHGRNDPGQQARRRPCRSSRRQTSAPAPPAETAPGCAAAARRSPCAGRSRACAR